MAQIKSMIEEEPANSFTSMIDITFLLLIFFILQPFKQEETKLRAYLPQGDGTGGTPTVQTTIRLNIQEAGGGRGMILINGDPLGIPRPSKQFPALLTSRTDTKLIEASQADPTVPVTITADPRVDFKYVLHTLDKCAQAEMKDVKFAAP